MDGLGSPRWDDIEMKHGARHGSNRLQAKKELLEFLPVIQSEAEGWPLGSETEPVVIKTLRSGTFTDLAQLRETWPMLMAWSAPWSDTLTVAVVDRLAALAETCRGATYNTNNYQISEMIKECAPLVSCTCDHALAIWSRVLQESQIRGPIDKFCEIVEFRKTMRRNLQRDAGLNINQRDAVPNKPA